MSAPSVVILLTAEGQGHNHAPLSIADGEDLLLFLRELSGEKTLQLLSQSYPSKKRVDRFSPSRDCLRE